MAGLRPDQYISVAAVTVGMLLTAAEYQPVTAPPQLELSFIEPTALAVPRATAASMAGQLAEPTSPLPPTPLQVTARSVIVIDANSRQVLLAHRPDAALPPASSVKIITALTAISTLPLDKVLTVQPPDLDTNNDTILEEGDQLAVRDALAALLVGSSNTAAKLLARHHSQGLPGFIAAMNDQAKLLGLSSTNLTNPIGLDQPGITSSARDLAIAAAALMDQPFLRQLVSSRDYSFNLINTGRQVTMTNTNQLLHQDPTVTGVKTGTTFLAGEVLVAQVERPAGSILVVVMGSQDRYAETQQLIDWTYRQYRWQPIDLTSYLVD